MKHTRPTCAGSVSTNFLQAKRRKTTVKCATGAGGGKEGVPWKDVENDRKRTICKGNVAAFSSGKRESGEVYEGSQKGTKCQWQLESPAREYLEQV